MELDPHDIPKATSYRQERIFILLPMQPPPPRSLLERMIDKGALTLSIDKALWALAISVTTALNPELLARVLELIALSL